MFTHANTFIHRVKTELNVYQQIAANKNTPWLAKWLLYIAIGYLLLPFDLIPDWIPVLGQLDDLLIVGTLTWFAIRLIPKEVIQEARGSKSSESINN
jgi:uncharacterized membrane protein YkvA (DUF1232 family)